MDDIRRVLKAAGARLLVIDTLRVLALTLTGGLVLVLVARVVERVFGLSHAFAPWWGWIFAGVGGAVLIATIAWVAARRRRELGVAKVVDERAGLRESLSTALCVERSSDPWAVAVVESASQRARRVVVRDAVPYELPRPWPMPLAAGAALAVVWFALPSFDVLGLFKKEEARRAAEERVVQVKGEIEANQKKLAEMLRGAKVDVKLDEPTSEGVEGMSPRELDPESLRRAEVKKLTDLAEKLEAMREQGSGAKLDAMKEQMRQLKHPGAGPMSEFARDLARGDFAKAEQAIASLEKQLESGSMSGEDRAKMKEQLGKMSGQLKAMGEQRKDAEKALEKAGLDKEAAAKLAKEAMSNPDALKKALESLPNLSPEQRESLLNAAASACEAAGQCSSMSESLSKMAEAMGEQGMSSEGQQAMDKLGSQLSDLEMTSQDVKNLEAALSECKGQLAQAGSGMGQCNGEGQGEGQEGMGDPMNGQFREGTTTSTNVTKGGMGGGPGRRYGANPEEEPAAFALDKSKAKVETRAGALIGTKLVYGEQVKGESRAEFVGVVESGAQAATEAIEANQVPPELRSTVKGYFGRLLKKAGDAPGATDKK